MLNLLTDVIVLDGKNVTMVVNNTNKTAQIIKQRKIGFNDYIYLFDGFRVRVMSYAYPDINLHLSLSTLDVFLRGNNIGHHNRIINIGGRHHNTVIKKMCDAIHLFNLEDL